MVNLQKTLTKILNHIKFVIKGESAGFIYHTYIGNMTSNSSGLINLTDIGLVSSNSSGCVLMCTTSNYKLSQPILWSNGNYYTVLTAWNSATPVANTQIRLIMTWFSAY